MKTLKEIIANEPPTSYRRVEALRGLIMLAESDDHILDYVLDLHNDESVPFRLKWARLLSKIDSPKVAQKFAECLPDEDNNHVLKTLVKGLAKSGDKSFVTLLEPFLEHNSHAIKHAVKMTIAELEYEPPSREPENREEPSHVLHKLPWRLKLKFFYRKYKLAIISIVFGLALIPASVGVYYGAVQVKELIVSFQPSPEEIVERDKLEAERRRLEELRQLEELQRLEEERRLAAIKAQNKKPFNWGLVLKGLILFIIFGAVAFLINKLFTILEKVKFKSKGTINYLGEKQETVRDSGHSHTEELKDANPQDLQDLQKNNRKGLKSKEGGLAKKIEKSTRQKDRKENSDLANEGQKNRREAEKEPRQEGEVIDLSGKKEKEVVGLSQKVLFSFLERFFKLFNNNWKKNSLRIFLPNELFYKIRFMTMLFSLKSIGAWIILFLIAISIHIYLLSDLEKFGLNQLGAYLKPFRLVLIIVLVLSAFYGFFIVNPFKLKRLNLHKIMSSYYYDRKYYFRKGEQEQWAILLRFLDSGTSYKSFSLGSLIFRFIFGLILFSIVNYFVIFPFVHFLNSELLSGIHFLDYSALKPSSRGGGKEVFALVTLIVFLPFFLMFDWRGEEGKEWAQKQKKKANAEKIEEEQERSLQEDCKSLIKEAFQGPSDFDAMRVICGVQKKDWFENVKTELLSKYDYLYLDVTYADDREAAELMKSDFYNLWLPDCAILAELMGEVCSKNERYPDGFRSEGLILKSPLVYVFRKSVLKKFLQLYQGVNYRSLTDANGKMRNLKEVDFSFVMPDYDDLEIGTYNLIMMMNEYFRTTKSYEGDIYKNKVFLRSLKEYISSQSKSKNKNKSSVFVTTEQKGIDFIHKKKGRGWQLVYPAMTLYMEHEFIVLNDSPTVSFLLKKLRSNQVQKSLGGFGWRPADFSIEDLYPDLMAKWKKYNVPDRLGVHSYLPEIHIIKEMIEVTKNVMADDS